MADSDISPEENGERATPFVGAIKILALTLSVGCFFLLITLVFLSYFAYHAVSDWSLLQSEKNITSIFYEYTEKIKSVTNLVLVERSSVETVERIFSRQLKLPFLPNGLKSEASLTIRCPVFYSYYVDMKGKWLLKLDGTTLYVSAPPLRCFPPAIDTSHIERKTENGWLVFGEPELLRDLEKDLSSELYKKAISPPAIQNVTKDANKGLEEFIRKWILNEKIKADKIVISFSNDTDRKKL